MFKKVSDIKLHPKQIKVNRVPLKIQKQQLGHDLFARETILGGYGNEEGFVSKRKIFKLKSDIV